MVNSRPDQPWHPLWIRNDTELGTETCVASPNSTGSPAAASATGTRAASFNRLQLRASGWPPASAVMWLTALGPRAPLQPPGSDGFLCLGNALGRFNRAGEILLSDASGLAVLSPDLSDLPDPTQTSVAVMPPETRHFQAWFRDTTSGGGATSNFTPAISVPFR